MRKVFSALLLCSITMMSVMSIAQSRVEKNAPLPSDPNVRIGTLPNGIKYYLRNNQKPENKIELRLAVNAGALMETDEQQGLAHFTEHMCFNGTKNFKKNELVSYLQSIGVKFGAHLNAYTSFDETVYMLKLPSDDADKLEKGFQILEDWAHQLSFEDEEIDKERGVVIEEWRLGQGAERRMLDKYLPVIFKDSRYAQRLPIGKKEVIENFEYQTIKDFYNTWYRPDLMAVVVVGDYDLELMEYKVKSHFGKIPAATEKLQRMVYDVPDHSETLIAIERDAEATYNRINLYYKEKGLPSKFTTINDYKTRMAEQLFIGMLNQRLDELKQTENPPFIYAGNYYGGTWARTKNAYQCSAIVGGDGVQKGLETLLEENQRVKQHGFTATELERYKMELLSRMEAAYNEREKTDSRNYASEYVRNFLEGEPAPGIEFEYYYYKKNLSTITLDDVNSLANEWIRQDNRVVVITASEKDDVIIPSKEEVLQIINDAERKNVEAYVDKLTASKLMEKEPAAGAIADSKKLENLSAELVSFANGINIYLKPTDFQDDEILFSAYSPGGHSLYEDNDYHSAMHSDAVRDESGLSEFSKTDLTKLLAGKTASVSAYVGSETEGLSGSCVPKDLETMLQLAHLSFTAPRFDETAFNAYISKNRALYKNLLDNPQYYYYDQLSRISSQDHLRGGGMPQDSDWDKINFERTQQIYKERFSDAGDFTFFMIGNFDVEEVKPLLAKYIGSLPASNNAETWKDRNVRPPSGVVDKVVMKGTDPKSMVNISFTGEFDYSAENSHQMKSLAELLTIKLIESLREEKSGVYGVGARASASKYPYQHYKFTVSFPCGPENVASLTEAVFEEIAKLKKDGPLAEDLNKVQETQRRDLEEKMKKNNYWLKTMQKKHFYKESLNEKDMSSSLIEQLTAESLKATANKYLKEDNYIRVVLMPQEETIRVKE